ncbi:hypothetical protein IFM89_033304, partial [Coptis chinensis]
MSCLTSNRIIVYRRECLKLIPHSKFSFAKIRLLVAQFEIRQKNIDGARKLLGNAIGRAPKDKVWISFAKFEAITGFEGKATAWRKRMTGLYSEQRKQRPPTLEVLFENAINHLRTSATELKEERAIFVRGVVTMESSFGDIGDVGIVQNKLPRSSKKGERSFRGWTLTGYEEYYDYIFPEEIAPYESQDSWPLYKWKKQKFSHTGGMRGVHM